MLLFVEGALNRREVGAEQRADIRAGGVDEGDQNDFAARRLEFKLFAGLIDEREVRCGDVGFAPADLAFLRRDWDMRVSSVVKRPSAMQHCAKPELIFRFGSHR